MFRQESLDERIRALGLGAPVTIRVSPKARRLSLRVDAAQRGVELVLPRRYSAEAALGFVAAPRSLGAGASVPVFGVPHRVCRETDPSAPTVAITDGEIRVRGDPAHLPRRVRDHLIALAK